MRSEAIAELKLRTLLEVQEQRQRLADCVAEFLRTIHEEPVSTSNLERLRNMGRDALAPIMRMPDGRWMSKPHAEASNG